MAIKLKIKKGDQVIVRTGKDKGKKGQILKIVPFENRALVQGVNMVQRHKRPSQTDPGGITPMEALIEISNLALVDPKTGEHSFGVKVAADPRIESEYARKGIKTEYTIKGNPQTIDQANALINAEGSIDAAISRVMTDTSLPGETRVVASQMLALRLNADALAAEASGRHEKAQAGYDKLIDFIEFVDKDLALSAGRTVQAFSQWQEMGPAGIMRKAQREVANAQKKAGTPDNACLYHVGCCVWFLVTHPV